MTSGALSALLRGTTSRKYPSKFPPLNKGLITRSKNTLTNHCLEPRRRQFVKTRQHALHPPLSQTPATPSLDVPATRVGVTMLSLEEVDAILQGSGSPGHALQSQQWPGDEGTDRSHRAQVLQDVSDTLQNLVYSGSQEAELVSQKLGDASRNRMFSARTCLRNRPSNSLTNHSQLHGDCLSVTRGFSILL